MRSYRRMESKSFMFKHWATCHPDVRTAPDFFFKVVKCHKEAQMSSLSWDEALYDSVNIYDPTASTVGVAPAIFTANECYAEWFMDKVQLSLNAKTQSISSSYVKFANEELLHTKSTATTISETANECKTANGCNAEWFMDKKELSLNAKIQSSSNSMNNELLSSKLCHELPYPALSAFSANLPGPRYLNDNYQSGQASCVVPEQGDMPLTAHDMFCALPSCFCMLQESCVVCETNEA